MKEIDDVMYEVEAKFVVEKEDDYGISANADEDADATEKRVINVVAAHRLMETGFDKKSYMGYIKGYMKKVKTYLEENNPDRVQPFMKGAQEFVKKILANFDDYQFFMGENMDAEAGIALMGYREDGVTPYFLVWKDGVNMEKY